MPVDNGSNRSYQTLGTSAAGHAVSLRQRPLMVQERLGHTSFMITMDIYSHVTPTMQRAAVNRFAAAVNGAG